MVDIEIIKRDLRQLRKVTHSIEAFMTMKDKHEKRLEYLSGLPPSKEVDEEKKRIEELLKRIDIQGYIARATALEEKYMAAIDKLDPLDKKIIIDGYINGSVNKLINAKGINVFSFDNFSFENFSFETGFANSYSVKCKERNFNFIIFRFVSDNDSDCIVNAFTVLYKINKSNKGVE